jgi:kynurenine 3-monooxygenase
MEKFTIVGSGLAGTLMACYLGRAGVSVDLYEKRPDPRKGGNDRGRSINLALSVRGLAALEEVGLAGRVMQDAIPMPGRMIHGRDGFLHFQPYGKDASQAIYSVSRDGLNVALIDAAEKLPGVRVMFAHRCTGIDLATNTLTFQDCPDIQAEVVIGADGVYSALRGELQRHERFDYAQDYLSHGYKELTIPNAPGGGFRMETHALHIWPRRRYMLIALPNADGSFTCTLFLPYEGTPSFSTLRTPGDVKRLFDAEFPDAVSLMPTLTDDFFRNPTGPLVTVRCHPWHHAERLVLLGDACHAVVPFLGQGMNAAFEDCSVLARLLSREPDRAKAFRAYEAARKPHTDTLADLAVYNFVEMRDHTGSRLFLWKKKWEVLLHRLLGRLYVPLYTLISFTRTPYHDALRRARKQDRIIRGILLAAGVGLVVLLLVLLVR